VFVHRNRRGAGWEWIPVVLLAAAGYPASASSFSIAPIRVELGTGQSRGVLTLHNDGDSPVTIQVNSVAWSQLQGEERYDPTHDVITTPPVFVLAAKSDQIVRVALRRGADPTRELSYRLLFQEVPQSADPAFNGLKVALRLSVPVFVAPVGTNAASAVTWQASSTGPDELTIRASNTGTAHLQVTDFDVLLGSGEQTVHVNGSRYVLPGSSVSWKVKLPSGLVAAGHKRIHGFSDQGEISADLTDVPP
jgi:fimbrial chaperone protein